MENEQINGGATTAELPSNEQEKDLARIVVFGGLEAEAGALSAGESLQELLDLQDLRIGALHQSDTRAANWAAQASIDILSLAALDAAITAQPTLPERVRTLGMGETESMANRPLVLCINGVRLGFVCLAEHPAGKGETRADILSLTAVDRVRMLLNQCDHVIVLVKSGLAEGELPLPEWRARYRRFIEAGASVVADTGCARGWETHQNGVIFYGLGSPAGADSLGLFLSLGQNGRLAYEARALQTAVEKLDFSENELFKQSIDEQNRLLTHEETYLRAVDEMCKRIYCESELAQKRGVLGLFSAHANEEARLLALLEDESLRLVALRALRLLKADDRHCREIAKKA
jgi:hypothetical protein